MNAETNMTSSNDGPAEAFLATERYLVDALLDNISDHIYFKDRQSRFIRINRSMARVFKLASPADAAGKTDFDFFTAEHAQRAFDDEQEIMRTGRPLIGREEMETWPDGSTTWVSTTKQCLRDTSGNIVGTFGISRDITERKLVEQALDAQAQELSRSNQELEQFAYVASHDLQEPLRMIASYNQLLQRRYADKLDSEAHEFICFAVDGAIRMQALITDLLAYSRVGSRAKAFSPIDCGEVLNRVLKNLEVAIEESGAKITRTGLPRVIGDATQLTQLFQNLIANAIKFRGSKPAVIQISAALHGGADAREWHFAVSDDGIGIAPQYFERIFVIFQRLHHREEYSGTGIGLAVCKKIVERHGGRIWVESAPDQGSTFHFTIPSMAEQSS